MTHLNDAIIQVGAVRDTCHHLIPNLPEGQFKNCLTEALQGVYWLSRSLNSMDPITGMGQKIPLKDYFDADVLGPEVEPKRKKPSSTPSPTPSSSVADIGGTQELTGYSYQYKCYYADIFNKHYDTKRSLSMHPPVGQCHCGYKYVLNLIYRTTIALPMQVATGHAMSVGKLSMKRGLAGNISAHNIWIYLCITAILLVLVDRGFKIWK